MVFSRIPCSLLSLDAEDALGIPQENLQHDVTRTRLDLDGRPLGARPVLRTSKYIDCGISSK